MAQLKSSPSLRSGGLPGLRGHPDAPDGNNAGQDNEDHGLKFSSFGPGQGSRAEDRANEAKVVADMEDVYAKAEAQRLNNSAFGSHGPKPSLLRDALNTSHVLSDGAAAIVDDSFLKCFTSMPADPWNWNAYLFPAWVLGVFLRHCILFPLRISLLLMAHLLFFPVFLGLGLFLKHGPRRSRLEQRLISWLCGAWMMAWCAVVKYHGPRPTPGPDKVWIANHTSMIDYAILCSHSPFAVIMQLHHGWVRFLQTRVLSCLGCLWFNRTDIKDRLLVAQRMKQHVSSPDSVPLLIFPEGTCVNNEYTVLFKRGAFELDAAVCPIAIKYNKIFVDAFWNSKRQSFSRHMLKLMSSWATVCDVWFLEPQHKREDETSDEFAGRVQRMIAETAGLQVVPWDGYLKYYNLGQAKPGLIEKRRKVFADVLRQHLSGGSQQSLEFSKAPLAIEDGPNTWRGPPGGMPAPVQKEPSSPWRGPCIVPGWGKEKQEEPSAPAAKPAHHEHSSPVRRHTMPQIEQGATAAVGTAAAAGATPLRGHSEGGESEGGGFVGSAIAAGAGRNARYLHAVEEAAATTEAGKGVAQGAGSTGANGSLADAEDTEQRSNKQQLRQRGPKTPAVKEDIVWA